MVYILSDEVQLNLGFPGFPDAARTFKIDTKESERLMYGDLTPTTRTHPDAKAARIDGPPEDHEAVNQQTTLEAPQSFYPTGVQTKSALGSSVLPEQKSTSEFFNPPPTQSVDFFSTPPRIENDFFQVIN